MPTDRCSRTQANLSLTHAHACTRRTLTNYYSFTCQFIHKLLNVSHHCIWDLFVVVVFTMPLMVTTRSLHNHKSRTNSRSAVCHHTLMPADLNGHTTPPPLFCCCQFNPCEHMHEQWVERVRVRGWKCEMHLLIDHKFMTNADD